MRFLLNLFAIGAVALPFASGCAMETENGEPEDTVDMASSEIIDGEYVASTSDAPWAAQVHSVEGNKTPFHCTASVIGSQWVLTAKHCVDDKNPQFVQVGSLKLNEGVRYDVDKKIKHSDKNVDLAIFHVTKPIDTTFIKLADKDPKVGDTNRIYGWGRTKKDFSSPASDRLKTATVKVTSTDRGSLRSTGESGYAWSGDSGGPQLAGGLQVGVASTADLNNPAQNYTSVAANRKFIKDTTGI